MIERAFVAGATGYTGREIVTLLCERGVPVCAHVRPDSGSGEQWDARFRAAGAEVSRAAWNADAMAAALREASPSHVFALLGTTSKRARALGWNASEAYERVDFGLTAMLIDAAAALPLRPRFVYLSSLGVTPSTKNPYLAARARAEAHLLDSGLPYTIARPSLISGDREESRPGERAASVVASAVLGAARWIGGRKLHDRYAPMTGRELACGLIEVATDVTCENAVADAARLRAIRQRG